MIKDLIVVGMISIALTGCAVPGQYDDRVINQSSRLNQISEQLTGLKDSIDVLAEQQKNAMPQGSNPQSGTFCLLEDRVYTSGAIVGKSRCAIVKWNSHSQPVRAAWVSVDSSVVWPD